MTGPYQFYQPQQSQQTANFFNTNLWETIATVNNINPGEGWTRYEYESDNSINSIWWNSTGGSQTITIKPKQSKDWDAEENILKKI